MCILSPIDPDGVREPGNSSGARHAGRTGHSHLISGHHAGFGGPDPASASGQAGGHPAQDTFMAGAPQCHQAGALVPDQQTVSYLKGGPSGNSSGTRQAGRTGHSHLISGHPAGFGGPDPASASGQAGRHPAQDTLMAGAPQRHQA